MAEEIGKAGESIGEYFPNVALEDRETITPTREWDRQDIFNVANPYFGVKYNTGLDKFDKGEEWKPEESEWVSKLSLDDKMAVSTAKTEDFAKQTLDRKALYNESKRVLEESDSTVATIAEFGAAIVDPTIVLPIGVTAAATKSAFTIGAKATKLAALSSESAIVSMAGATASVAAFKGQGLEEGSTYGMTNLYAALIGGGLPIIANTLAGGYSTAKVAKGFTTDPKNFAALSGELTVEKIGGTQARTLYTKIMPKWAQSDVLITASSDNKFVTLVSNRIDSPSIAVVDRNTGEPVPIGTTGQDYKSKFNGKQRLLMGDIRGLHRESTIKSSEDFEIEVGRVVRARAVRQEQLTYEELNDAIDFSTKEAKAVQAQEREDFLNTFKEDPATLPEGVEAKIQKRTAKEIKEFDEAADIKFKEGLAKAIETRKVELYDKHQLEFEHADPKVVEAAKKTDEYYASILDEGHKLKIAELSKIKGNKHYMTRIFDFQAIRETDMDVLVSKILKGLEGHIANKGKGIKDLEKAALDIATKLKNLDYTRDWADFSFFVPKELGSTAFLSSKKLKLNDTFIQDLLVTNIDDVVGQYSYSQVGHFSANHSFPELQGIPREEQLDKFKELFIEPLVKSGSDAKEVNSLKNMFEDMLGTFRMAKDSNSAVWKGTRIMNSINSLTYGGSFALNTAAELGGLLLDGQVKNVMKTRLGVLSEIGTMFSGKTIEDPLVRDFILMGQLENLMETNSMLKMADTETVFNVGRVENGLNKGLNQFFKYNGLRGATVALEAMVGPKVIHDIMSLGIKDTISTANTKYLSRIGLSHADTKRMSSVLKKVGTFTDSGKVYDLNLDKWGEVDLDKITTAIGRGMKHTVIKGDTTYLPSGMIKPNAFNRLAFQFLRYPMAAAETLLLRGLNESKAKWLAATMTSTFMMSMVMYGREQAAIAAGLSDKNEAKFDKFWEDEDAAMRLFAGALGKAGTLGPLDLLRDRGGSIAQVSAPGSEYVNKDVLGAVLGPTFSRIPQLSGLLHDVLIEGRLDSKSAWYTLKGMSPGATMPLVSEYLSTQIKENTH